MEFQAIEQLDNGQTDILCSQTRIELGGGGVLITAVPLQINYKIQIRDI